MFTDNRLVKLKASLADAIERWIEKEASEGDGRDALSTYFGDFTAELMADAAFIVLLAQSDLSDYLRDQELLKDGLD
jgi:hypothetical protein